VCLQKPFHFFYVDQWYCSPYVRLCEAR
jgi:hypothetical protein